MYKTVQGDTWDIVSKKQYGTEKHMSLLIQNNPEYSEIVIFPAGIILKTPEIETSLSRLQGLPPWKRNS